MYLEKLQLRDRVAVVTGAGQGIGEACAIALAQAGARVIVTDMIEARVEDCIAKLKAGGHSALGQILDVTCAEAVTAFAERILAREGRVDILVNNAGIARSGTAAEKVGDELWLNVLDVNLNGTFWCCRAFGKIMLAAGRGAIVNVGSMGADIVVRPQNQSYYNASKAAVHHLTKSLAAEWADRGVRVNAVAPTYIATPLNDIVHSNPGMYETWMENTPMHRMGRPDEVASIVHFLASDAASLMTGSIVVADAGYTCW